MRLSEEELTRELRAMRPEIDRDFAAELDAWAAAGFPSAKQIERGVAEEPHKPPSPLREGFRRVRERPLLPALAGATTIVLAVTISVGVWQAANDGIDEESIDEISEPLSAEPESDSAAGAPLSGAPGADDAERAEESASGSSVIAPEPVPPVPPRQGQLKPGEPREVARDASMKLSTEPDQVAEVADGVIEVTERYDGIVLSSNVDTSADRGRATFDLRIPAQNLQATLADLSDLASVSERNEGSLDVTAPFISAEERFDDAKAEVDALIEQLGEAESADEIAEIREQLQVARAELAAARAELVALKQRTDFSTLAVTVVGDGDADGWSFGDAVDDAGSVLEDLAGAMLVALAVILPLGLIAAALWFGIGAARRRSRERALDD